MKLTVTYVNQLHGHQVMCFQLENQRHTRLAILNYGGIIQEFSVIDGNERINLLTPVEDLTVSRNNGRNINCLLGRVAGIIQASRFVYEGDVWNLPTNYYTHTINGGPHGFSTQFFNVTTDGEAGTITLHYQASEQFDGFPGTLDVAIVYQLTEDDAVHITFTGHQKERPGIFNPTIKTYFDLGKSVADITNSKLAINAQQRLLVDADNVPTGEVTAVSKDGFNCLNVQSLSIPSAGVAANYIMPPDLKQVAVTLTNSVTKRMVQVFSNHNGLYLEGAKLARGQLLASKQHLKPQAVVIMPQNLPNSVNIPEFGSISIAVGETKRYDIIYRYIKIN
ncbi:aldose epimerase family protein [Periweissella fabalis]|uniref:Aldose 1-epimerase n=1 Tax=Periweissella fabalis TaxID=1070421 RepID=A0A7X6N039_9LACO|nr:hypothetical protein [Periweissella fabalis]MCM0599056.1 hypothetical protein [Periweissella fabalis]NKZ23336.1 hypothetical protein [Periweissella fabalis]